MCFCILAVFTGIVYWNMDEGIDGMRWGGGVCGGGR